MGLFKKTCATSAAALIAVAGIAPVAIAQDMDVSNTHAVTGANADTKIILSKQINASTGVDTNGDVFTFTFQPTLKSGETAVTDEQSADAGAYLGPNIADHTLTAGAMAGDKQVLEKAVTLPALDKTGTTAGCISHAGMYEYIVKEKAGTKSNWEYSQAVYIMRLYVVNDDTAASGLKYDGITVEQIKSQSGSTEEGDVEGKVDPTDSNMDTTKEIQTELTPSGFLFQNTYVGKADLEVSKDIIGDYANKAKEFPFTVTLDLPAVNDQEATVAADAQNAYTYTIHKRAKGVVDRSAAGTTTPFAVTEGNASINIVLADDEFVVFNDLPVGTKYTVSETSNEDGVNKYDVKAKVTYTNANGSGDYATKTDQYFGVQGSTDTEIIQNATDNNASTKWTKGPLTVNKTDGAINTQTLVAPDGSKVEFTNSLDNPPSPTGLAIQYGPYVLLTIAAAAGLTYLAVGRRRRDSKED